MSGRKEVVRMFGGIEVWRVGVSVMIYSQSTLSPQKVCTTLI